MLGALLVVRCVIGIYLSITFFTSAVAFKQRAMLEALGMGKALGCPTVSATGVATCGWQGRAYPENYSNPAYRCVTIEIGNVYREKSRDGSCK